jgi:chromosome segregation ATPase
MKDADEFKTNIAKMSTENQRLHSTIKNMEKDTLDLKNEIRNRDETISDKEKTITEQKRTGIELEKNRFVLEHKIENLKQQILPKDDLIMDLRSQIDAMEDELNAVTKTQNDLQVGTKVDCSGKRLMVCWKI